MAACGGSQRPSTALASDDAEAGDKFSKYGGPCERGCLRRACCVYASLDEPSSPVGVENWRGVCDASDDAGGP